MNSKSHRAFIRMNGRLISKTFTRKTDADRWYQTMKRERELMESGLADDLRTQTVGEFVRAWLETRRANGQPLSSYAQEESRMRLYVLPRFEKRDLDSVMTTEWEHFLDDLMRVHEASPATRNRVRAMLSKLYNDAMRMRVTRVNPITLIPKLKEKAKKWDYFKAPEDCAKYLSEAKKVGSGFYVFACLALNTGMRLGEILALHFEDVDLVRRRVRVWRIVEAASDDVCERTKGFTERWLGINESLFGALSPSWTDQGAWAGGPLIVDAKGTRFDHKRIRTLHMRVCKNAGLPAIRVHDLRHTFASHYIMNGGSLAELQGLLGHTSPAMTLKYAHMAPGFLESRASVVSFSSEMSQANIKLVVSNDRGRENKKSWAACENRFADTPVTH